MTTVRRPSVCTSADPRTEASLGVTWRDSQILNPDAGADLATLRNGHWVLAFNDTERGRHSLAVSLSTDEGETWSQPRHLEQDSSKTTSFAYPAVVQREDDTVHVVYSYHGRKSNGETHKTIKHVRFNEGWITDPAATGRAQ